MSNFTLLFTAAFLSAVGTFLLMSRKFSRIIFGIIIFGNALNLFIISVSGPAGNPAFIGKIFSYRSTTSDPLAQALVLTGIVIPLGLTAFCLALLYRFMKITNQEEVIDEEDTTIGTNITESEEDLVDNE